MHKSCSPTRSVVDDENHWWWRKFQPTKREISEKGETDRMRSTLEKR